MGKWAHPSVNREHMIFTERPLSVSFLAGKVTVQKQVLEDYNIWMIANKIFAKNLMTNVIIERITQANALLVHIITNNSNNLVGSNSEMIDKFKKRIEKEYGSEYKNIQVGILAVKNIHTDVHTIARAIVFAIESSNGTNYMRLARSLAEQVYKNVGLLGIFIKISGRINGGTIASNQKLKYGTVKAQTLTIDITQAVYHAKTKTGMMGVKVTLAREKVNRKFDAFDTNDENKKSYAKPRDFTKKEFVKRPYGDRPFNKFSGEKRVVNHGSNNGTSNAPRTDFKKDSSSVNTTTRRNNNV